MLVSCSLLALLDLNYEWQVNRKRRERNLDRMKEARSFHNNVCKDTHGMEIGYSGGTVGTVVLTNEVIGLKDSDACQPFTCRLRYPSTERTVIHLSIMNSM